MTNINIDDDLYKKLKKHYDKLNKLQYPTLKNYVERVIDFAVDSNLELIK
jgi:hypothetical protein